MGNFYKNSNKEKYTDLINFLERFFYENKETQYLYKYQDIWYFGKIKNIDGLNNEITFINNKKTNFIIVVDFFELQFITKWEGKIKGSYNKLQKAIKTNQEKYITIFSNIVETYNLIKE
jgi:hypothetical protein